MELTKAQRDWVWHRGGVAVLVTGTETYRAGLYGMVASEAGAERVAVVGHRARPALDRGPWPAFARTLDEARRTLSGVTLATLVVDDLCGIDLALASFAMSRVHACQLDVNPTILMHAHHGDNVAARLAELGIARCVTYVDSVARAAGPSADGMIEAIAEADEADAAQRRRVNDKWWEAYLTHAAPALASGPASYAGASAARLEAVVHSSAVFANESMEALRRFATTAHGDK